jgi:GNAT superfamily N-acetyltransferase
MLLAKRDVTTIACMAWRVRLAMATDAEAVRAVASSAWRDTYAGLLRAETIEAFIDRAYSLVMLERRIAQDYFLVVEDDGQVAAFADVVEAPDRLNLAAIYALPEVRGQGAGTLLLEAIRSHFARRPIAADVLAGNRKGEVFYERRGFTPHEILKADLFGEPIVERRWWLEASSASPEQV